MNVDDVNILVTDAEHSKYVMEILGLHKCIWSDGTSATAFVPPHFPHVLNLGPSSYDTNVLIKYYNTFPDCECTDLEGVFPEYFLGLKLKEFLNEDV